MEVTISWQKVRYFKKSSLLNKRKPTNANVPKFRKAQEELTNMYEKEQLEWIQCQIDKVRNSVEDRQSQIVC